MNGFKPNEQVIKKENIVLIAEDSFAARLDQNLLGKSKKVVRNIAIGGIEMEKVKEDIENFVKDNPTLEVTKLFVSVGTNDIRYWEIGIAYLKGAVSSHMRTIKMIILPNAKVWFQSLPPINPNPSAGKRDRFLLLTDEQAPSLKLAEGSGLRPLRDPKTGRGPLPKAAVRGRSPPLMVTCTREVIAVLFQNWPSL